MLSGANQLLTPRHFFFFPFYPLLLITSYILLPGQDTERLGANSLPWPIWTMNESKQVHRQNGTMCLFHVKPESTEIVPNFKDSFPPPGGVRRKKESDYVALISTRSCILCWLCAVDDNRPAHCGLQSGQPPPNIYDAGVFLPLW